MPNCMLLDTNLLMAKEQNQSGEIMFYAGTLQDHLRRKLLKRIHSNYRPPRNLQEAFDLTLDFKKVYWITQPLADFAVMETCYKDPTAEDVFTTEEVQTQSQSQQQGHNIRSSNIKNSKTIARSLTKETKT